MANCPDSGGTVPIFVYFGFLAIIYAHVVVIFLAMVDVGMSISKCILTKVSIPAKSTESNYENSQRLELSQHQSDKGKMSKGRRDMKT
jgi:hypothetical protein